MFWGHFYNFNIVCPEFDSKKDYYKEFWRVYLQNEIILIDMKDFVVDIKNLQEQIKKVEVHILSFLWKNRWNLLLRNTIRR